MKKAITSYLVLHLVIIAMAASVGVIETFCCSSTHSETRSGQPNNNFNSLAMFPSQTRLKAAIGISNCSNRLVSVQLKFKVQARIKVPDCGESEQ